MKIFEINIETKMIVNAVNKTIIHPIIIQEAEEESLDFKFIDGNGKEMQTYLNDTDEFYLVIAKKPGAMPIVYSEDFLVTSPTALHFDFSSYTDQYFLQILNPEEEVYIEVGRRAAGEELFKIELQQKILARQRIKKEETPTPIAWPEFYTKEETDEKLSEVTSGLTFELSTHIQDNSLHTSEEEKTFWNEKVSYEDFSAEHAQVFYEINFLKEQIKNLQPKFFGFKANENTSISLNKSTSSLSAVLQYSFDGFSWDAYTWEETSGEVISLAENEKVYFKGNNDTFSTSTDSYFNFEITGEVECIGSIASLLRENMKLNALSSEYCFTKLFLNCNALRSTPEMPMTTLAAHCYENMYSGCTSLTRISPLPATILAPYCYAGMYNGCTSAYESFEELPALRLETQAYYKMFYGCTLLETAPEIKASTVAPSSCMQMYYGCTSLKNAPTIDITAAEPFCFAAMYQNCGNLQRCPELPATTLATSCYQSMFQGAAFLYDGTDLRTTITLPAPTLVASCYKNMFRDAVFNRKLVPGQVISVPDTIEIMATTIVSTSMDHFYYAAISTMTLLTKIKVYFTSWVSGATPSWLFNAIGRHFYKPTALPATRGANYIPSNWTIHNV